MKSLTPVLAFLFSLNTYASIEPGTWKGRVSDQANCFMEVGEQTFENGIRNPLNERIAITIGMTKYSVRHPYSINPTDGTVGFNHDLFEAVMPTATGTFALQIVMKNTPDFEGPVSYSVMEDDWASGFKEVVNCYDVKLHKD